MPRVLLAALVLLLAAPLGAVRGDHDLDHSADLIVLAVATDPAEPIVGDDVGVVATLRNNGTVDAGPFVVRFHFPGRDAQLEPVAGLAVGETLDVVSVFEDVSRDWSGQVAAYADWENDVFETDEENNHLHGPLVQVRPLPADVSVRIVEIVKPRLRTDFGDSPHPLGTRLVVTEVCNEDRRSFDSVWVTVLVRGRTLGFDVLRQGNVGALASGECLTFEDAWRVAGTFGDVTVEAEVDAAHDEVDFRDNRHVVEDFVVVGGLGVGFL